MWYDGGTDWSVLLLSLVQVLEARHIEDKALAAKQEKKIKRLRAEMEALQHMNDANTRDDASELHSEHSYRSGLAEAKQQQQQYSKTTSASVASPLSTKSSAARPLGTAAPSPLGAQVSSGSANHLIGADAYQYIDPSILKVLEKVDSQFSITNAITLATVLKKWLHSCLFVMSSTHIPTVLQL